MTTGRIATLWERERDFLDIPGIQYRDDTIVVVHFASTGSLYRSKRVTVLEADKVIGERGIDVDDIDAVESATVHCSLEIGNQIFYGGEGTGNGAMGCVAACERQGKQENLLWLAYFRCSNPFVSLETTPGFVHARSSLEATWSFRLADPSDITVTADMFGKGPCEPDE